MSEKTTLKQTKGEFKVIGKVTRIDKDYAFRQDKYKSGKNKGKPYRALKFGVKTSPTNEVTVEMFDSEPEKVTLWNSEKAKKAREKNQTYKAEKIDYLKWQKTKNKLKEKGYVVLSSRIGLETETDDNGKEKIKSEGLPSYVASKLIHDKLDNGDSVLIEGEIRYSTYENNQGKTIKQKKLTIKTLLRLPNEVDFESDKFEEVSYFEQPMVYVDAEIDKKEGKAFVYGRIIDYKEDWIDNQFVIKYADKDENGDTVIDDDMKLLATSMVKKVKFGDLVTVFGNIENRMIVEKIDKDEDSKSKESTLEMLGGKKKPSHAEKNVNRTYISEMQIEGISAWDEKYYKEDDFVKNAIEEDISDDLEDDSDLSKEFGGKKKSKNPFDKNEDLDDDPFADSADDDDPFADSDSDSDGDGDDGDDDPFGDLDDDGDDDLPF